MNGRQLCEERSLTGRHCVYPVSLLMSATRFKVFLVYYMYIPNSTVFASFELQRHYCIPRISFLPISCRIEPYWSTMNPVSGSCCNFFLRRVMQR